MTDRPALFPIRGLHHVTAIASDAQANHDFYVRTLGLRLVKKTVNFDDPGTYHLYFGDERGSPGTIMTFFPWPGARRGTRGNGETQATSFLVPPGSIDAWKKRLRDLQVQYDEPAEHFGERALRVHDPDDLLIDLVEHEEAHAVEPWTSGGVSADMAIRGFFGVTLSLRDPAATRRLLSETMGYKSLGENGGVERLVSAGDAADLGRRVDLLSEPESPPGHTAAGSVHHIAFRVPDDAQQLAWIDALRSAGQRSTAVQERHYFRSVYFRELGGVLFEFATDGPGMAIDEPLEALGQSLKIPPWYEQHRAQIEQVLPPLQTPP